MAWLRAFGVQLLLVLAMLTPAGAQQRFEEFTRPTIKDFRLDFCRHIGGRECGQPAADLFCQEKGFERADFWTPSGPTDGATVIFGDGMLCPGPGCLAFGKIRCVAGLPPPPPPPPAPESQPFAPPPQTPPVPPVPPVAAAPVFVELPLPRPRPEPRPPAPVAAAPVVAAEPVLVAEGNPPPFTGIFVPPPEGAPFTVPNYSVEAVTANWITTLINLQSYPGGAELYECQPADCSFALTADKQVNPADEYQTITLRFDVARVPHAGGGLWQVSYLPFPPFANASDQDYVPPGLLLAGRDHRVGGFFSFDLRVLAEDLPAAAMAPGGPGAILHVRVLPVTTVGTGEIVGQPSNVMRIFYGAEAPEPEPFEFYEPEIVAEAPPVELASIEFKPHRFIDLPPGCLQWEEWRRKQEKSFLEKIGDAFADIWNFAAEAYQWAKDRVIDIASALTFGVIPDGVLEFALNTALASAGIPPDIPNLDEMINGGLDHLASEMAKTAVSQIPSADLAVSLGNVAADITVEAAASMAENELRARLEEELERKSREALIRAADEIERARSTPNSDALCQRQFIPPSYRVTVVNTGPDPLEDIKVGVGDSEGVYWGIAERVDLRPGQSLSFMAVPDPHIIDVWDPRLTRMETMAQAQNSSHWWNEILRKQLTSLIVTLPGHRECLGSCINTVREVHRSPPQLLTEPYVGAGLPGV